METEIDGLLITILKGGEPRVGRWAKDEGFALPPTLPRSSTSTPSEAAYFMAARFIPEKARRKKLREGDGIPIHLRIPTDNPWVPLRILGLGKEATEVIEADVFLLNDREPALLPAPAASGERGMALERSEQASQSLLNDLGSDKGMNWIQEEAGMWLTYLRLDIDAGRPDLRPRRRPDGERPALGRGRIRPAEALRVNPDRTPVGMVRAPPHRSRWRATSRARRRSDASAMRRRPGQGSLSLLLAASACSSEGASDHIGPSRSPSGSRAFSPTTSSSPPAAP